LKSNAPLYLITVIAKIKNISESEYDGKIYDNILAIFNKLSTKEKRVLLRGLINLCFLVEDKVLLNKSDIKPVADQLLVHGSGHKDHTPEVSEPDSVINTQINEHTLKKIHFLEKSMNKTLLIILLGVISLVVITLSSFGSDVYTSITRELMTVLKYIILL